MSINHTNNCGPDGMEYSNTRTVTIAKECLMFTPKITKIKLLQLRKLTEVSDHLDVKLYLVKHFIPQAKVIMANQSSDYAKDKILNIIASICHIDEAIEMIGKDSELVRIILRFFGTCNNNIRLQITLFKLLQLIACEIQSNPKSNWTLYLTNSSYFFAPNIIAILKKTKTVKVMLDGIALLHTLFDVKLTDGTSFLEQLFNVNELIDVLTRVQSYIQNNICYNNKSKVFWAILEKWMSIMIIIRYSKPFVYSKPFIRVSREFENDIQCLYMLHEILYIQNTIYAIFRNLVHKLEEGKKYHSKIESTVELFVPTFFKAIDLFLSFSVTLTGYIKAINNITDVSDMYTIAYLPQYESKKDLFRYYITLTEVMHNIQPIIIRTSQYIALFVQHFMPMTKCRQLLEELLQLTLVERHFILNFLLKDIKDVPCITVEKLRKIKRCCIYMMY